MKIYNKHFHGQMSDRFRTALFIILSGGFQDAYTYISRGGVFANAQTGNIVLMSSAMFDGDASKIFKYLIPVVSFILGIATAEVVHMHFKHYEKIHWRQMILFSEIILLFVVGFLPHRVDYLANALVSYVCALQVQTFHKIRGHAYASTMCIGNLRSGTAALSLYLRDKKAEHLRQTFYYFGIIFFFAIGAGIGGILSVCYGIHVIWISCILLFISFLLMFLEKLR